MLPWSGQALSGLVLGVLVGVAEMFTPVTNSFVVSYRVSRAPDGLQGRVQAASTLLSFSAGWAAPLALAVLSIPVFTRPPGSDEVGGRSGVITS